MWVSVRESAYAGECAGECECVSLIVWVGVSVRKSESVGERV